VKAFVTAHSNSTEKSVPVEAVTHYHARHTSVVAPGDNLSFETTDFIGLRESLLEVNS